MSILRKDYEISVWKDTWESDKFIEERLGIIGSDSMSYEGRAIEPNFSRNVNGVKKLSFKMYKYFIDPITGEKTLNPFVDWLVSERKVKLYYEDKWYDFIIKNIVEDSKNYLYTYQLEDALVQELSKNGFGVTLDMKLNNNMGTANELAAEVLKETDWKVHEDSEAFVERVDETLVYVTINTNELKDGAKIWHIIDQNEKDRREGITVEPAAISGTVTALAFYSSCAGKPHRFQFIYLETLANSLIPQLSVYKDDNRTIAEKNCQYYIDFDSEADYIEAGNNFYLPSGITTIAKKEDKDYSPTILSCKYRGERYGFAQQAKYIPVLDRYCNIYETEDKSLYYGYLNADYKSPALTTNLISGSALDSTHGWTGTRYDSNSGEKAVVESVFGYFNNDVFVDSINEIKKGTFDPTDPNKPYESYLKITFPENVSSACVINSCIYDNRTLIGNISRSDQWALKCETLGGPGQLAFKLQECKYDPANDCYDEAKGVGLVFNDFSKEGDYYIARMGNNSAECSEKDFKKNTQARLVITASAPGDYYIKNISLFKASYVNGKLITLEEQLEDIEEVEDRIVEKTYYYFSPAALDNITEASELKPDYTSKILDYSTYKPVYNTGAEKVRSVTAKESNYFNILQSIAETFEAWLLLEVERDELGGIINKSVKFKNYIGKDNYAGFHYGVNLQGIQRTYESKNIVTKLMVKSNSNEYAPNGFCTIQRANANPTGESYIYDFQYYFNRGLMNARDYLETIYIWNGEAIGPDIAGTTGLNLQGYYPRIKALNEQIEEKNEILLNTAKDIVQYRAELEVATAGVDAASNGLEQVREDFEALTKVDFPTDKAPLSEELGKRLDVQKLLKEYATYYSEYINYSTKKGKAEDNLDAVQEVYDTIESEINALKESKIALNQLFFKQYSRFIQEGTWIDEEYVDDELYYADALSVLYNSCYPQVAYQINVLELSKLSGYELFKFELGDKTYAEDPEFFGKGIKEEVIITELNENLDDPSKNTVKVQNFKNQFQDLFQKITATVQQAQYRTGSYERAVALAEANNERKNQFLSDALDTASARLTTAGQQSVTWGADGITVQDVDSPSDMIRMVGGAILLSKQDKNGEQKWVTGVTSDGISASLVTAGVVNTGEISIMNYDEPVFRWDSYGISAYDATWENTEAGNIVSEVNSKRFVRFDKNGIYGIDGIDGQSWIPTNLNEIDDKASYYLTWDGLKVSPENLSYTKARDKNGHEVEGPKSNFAKNHFAKLGRVSDYIYNSWDTATGLPYFDAETGNPTFVKLFAVGSTDKGAKSEEFVLYSDGTLVTNNIKLTGGIQWTAASSPSKSVYGSNSKAEKPADGTLYNQFEEKVGTWHRICQEDDVAYCHTDNGGASWDGPFLLTGLSIIDTIFEYYVGPTGKNKEWLEKPSNGVSWKSDLSEVDALIEGKCLYIRIYDKYNDGTISSYRYLTTTSPVADLTLTPSTLVVQEDQNGKLTPETITFTASASYLSDENGYSWTGVDNTKETGNIATLTTKNMTGDAQKVTVEYGGATDTVTIIKVKEGSDAISAMLTNPSMVFNKIEGSAVEYTSVLVFRGAESIPYGKTTETSNGWYYTLEKSDSKVTIENDGRIKVTNPQTTKNIEITLTIYKGTSNQSETKTLTIACTMVENNLRIALSNDSGTVVTDEFGKGGVYSNNTKTTVSVYDGSTDVSKGYDYTITTNNKGITIETTEDKRTIYVKGLPDNINEGVITITATKAGGTTLTTNFKVSKLKQGATGNAYWLQSSSPIIAKDADGTYLTTQITFTPMIQVGTATPRVATEQDKVMVAVWRDNETPPREGTLKGAQTYNLADSGEGKTSVSSAIHCRMFLDGIKVDEQTAEVIGNGVKIESILYGVSANASTTPTEWYDDISSASARLSDTIRYLWTKITYTDGSISYQYTYQPLDSYHIELDNDSDVIAVANGNIVGVSKDNPIIVKAIGYAGNSPKDGGDWEITPPSNNKWNELHYTTADNNQTLKIFAIPAGETSGEFEFKWTYNNQSYSKKFSLTTVVSNVDWNLLFDKRIVNANDNENERTVSIIVEKIDSTGRTKYTEASNIKELPVQVQYKTKSSDWMNLAENQKSVTLTGKTQFRLVQKVKDGVIDKDFIWDEEEIGEVHNGVNGDSVKRVNTYERTTISEDEVRNLYGVVDHEDFWYTQESSNDEDGDGNIEDNDNSHISVGDTAYIVGTTSDSGIPYAIYGVVTSKDKGAHERNGITLKTSYYIMGGTQGVEGKIALSPLVAFSSAYDTSSNKTHTGTISTELNRPPVVGEVFSVLCGGGEYIAVFKVTKVEDNGQYTAEAQTVTSLKGTDGDPAISVELTNDSATIFAPLEGEIDFDLLKGATTTTVIVKHGTSDMSDSYYYSWVSEGGDLNDDDVKTVYFTKIEADTATAVVEVYSDSEKKNKVAEKQMTVTKLQSGKNGFAYRLYVSPNSWNKSTATGGKATIHFYANKITPAKVETLTLQNNDFLSNPSGDEYYYVRISGETRALGTSREIDEDKTFELVWAYKDTDGYTKVVVDAETVTSFENGSSGPKGDTESTKTIYLKTAEKDVDKITTPSTGINLSPWTDSEPTYTNNDTEIYIWKTVGNYSKTSDGTIKYDHNWETPTLYAAKNSKGVAPKDYANYLRLTNFDETNAFDYIDGKLYINATYIKSGALTVTKGGNGNDKGNVIFKAGWKESGEGDVEIAGWKITENAITKKVEADYGQQGKYYFTTSFSAPQNRDTKVFSVTSQREGFGATDPVYITANGQLCCTSGDIGGWTVNGHQLTQGNIGEQNSFHMYSNNYGVNSDKVIGGHTALIANQDNPGWKLTIGNNFGVTSDGAIYASKGKIGNVEIEAIENKLENVTSRNLVLDSKGPFTLIPQQTDSEGKIYAVKSLELAKTLKANTTYTVSFDMKEKDDAIGSYKIGLYYYATGGSNRQQAAPMQTSPENETNGKKIHKITTSSTIPENSYKCVLAIYVYKKETTTGVDQSVVFEEIKLEEGESATAWTPAPEDAMQASVSNDFSWKFSPTDGMFMWNGSQNSDPVFKVWKNLKGDHELFVKGRIEADSGNIGELEIKEQGILGTDFTLKKDGLFLTGEGSSITLNSLAIKNTGDASILNATGQFTIQALDGDGGSLIFNSGQENYSYYDLWVNISGKANNYGSAATVDISAYYKEDNIRVVNPTTEEIVLYIDSYCDDDNTLLAENETVTLKFKKGKDISETSTISLPIRHGLHILNQKSYLKIGLSSSSKASAKLYYYDPSQTGGLSTGSTWFSNQKKIPKTKKQIIVNGNLLPVDKLKTQNIGNSDQRWNIIYATAFDDSGSDERIKNSIQEFDARYEKLFDSLIGVRYKYNEGTSNRYHTGFIAQQVVDSLTSANLNTQDFAAVMLNHPGEEDECWYLRRDEFVALNTWQIQKLKPRMASAEEKLLAYEARISVLEKEIENLKKS